MASAVGQDNAIANLWLQIVYLRIFVVLRLFGFGFTSAGNGFDDSVLMEKSFFSGRFRAVSRDGEAQYSQFCALF